MTRLLAVSHTGLWSGAETVLLRLLERTRAEGWDVAAATPAGPLADRVRAAGVRWSPLPDLKLPPGPRPLAVALLVARNIRAARSLRRAAAGADVVVANGLLSLPALRVARVGRPTAWIVHDVVRRPSWRRLARVCRPAVDLAIAVSDAVADPLRMLGFRTDVVRNGTPWPVDGRPDVLAGPPIVGCAAMLTPWKGQHVLLDAIARLPTNDVIVELAGGAFPKDGAYVERLRRRATDSDLVGRVRFLGDVPDLPARLRTWTVAVSASIDPEAGPLNVLEAMSVGIPLVGTDHGGTPEVLGDAGLLVPPGDPDAMATAIHRLLFDSALRRRCADAGRRQVADGLSLDAQLGRLVDVLERLAARSSG